jgi:hypothetical protein
MLYSIDRSTYQDETDIFYKNPQQFIDTYFVQSNTSLNEAPTHYLLDVPGQQYKIRPYEWTSHVVLFSSLEEDIRTILSNKHYKEVRAVFIILRTYTNNFCSVCKVL